MKKKFALLFAGLCFLNAQTNYNVSLYGHWDKYGEGTSTISYSEIWGWTDTATNREYAIIGTPGGTSIIDITEPLLKEVSFHYGPPSGANYHEFRTYKHYLYVGSEGADTAKRAGIQIIDLSTLPDSATFKKVFVWVDGNTKYYRAHTVSIEKNFLYVNGGDFGGTRIMDLTDPLHPLQAGSYGKGSTPYVHDSFIRNDTLYAAAIEDGRTDIVNFTMKGHYTETTTTKIVSKTPTIPEGSTHQVWLSDNGNYMFVSTETTGGHLHIYDITDKTAPVEIASWSSSPTASIHNSFVQGDFLYIAYYTEGLRILDISHPHTPIEVGFYDTYTSSNPPTFNGAWGAYPYFPSGKIAVSDMNTGLYVFTFNNKYGGRVTGTVRDGITGGLLNNVQVTVQEMGRTFSTDFSGRYTYGTAEGLHTITFHKEGYGELTDTFTTRAGALDTLNIILQPIVTQAQHSANSFLTEEFLLAQNYPNPFNPSTSITFSIPAKGFVNISVYNLLGKKVATVVDQNLGKGKHTVNFSAHPLSSGIYFYRLTAGSYSAVKRMTVLK